MCETGAIKKEYAEAFPLGMISNHPHPEIHIVMFLIELPLHHHLDLLHNQWYCSPSQHKHLTFPNQQLSSPSCTYFHLIFWNCSGVFRATLRGSGLDLVLSSCRFGSIVQPLICRNLEIRTFFFHPILCVTWHGKLCQMHCVFDLLPMCDIALKRVYQMTK